MAEIKLNKQVTLEVEEEGALYDFTYNDPKEGYPIGFSMAMEDETVLFTAGEKEDLDVLPTDVNLFLKAVRKALAYVLKKESKGS